MQESDLPGLAAQVLWAAFFLAAVFGAIAQRTHFCTMGAVADIVNIGDWSRMRMWALAIGVAMLGFNGMVYLGWVDAGKSIYAGNRLIWLSNLLGGALFGVGMVLASGCGSKTLVRIGGGSLKAVVVFAVLAIAAYATMRGIVGVARVATVDTVAVTLPTGQDLPSLLAGGLGADKKVVALVLG
ncbi:MAG: YeeE/YedE thiosulfate transporter family protein, partial [Rubrivivax sp.]